MLLCCCEDLVGGGGGLMQYSNICLYIYILHCGMRMLCIQRERERRRTLQNTAGCRNVTEHNHTLRKCRRYKQLKNKDHHIIQYLYQIMHICIYIYTHIHTFIDVPHFCLLSIYYYYVHTVYFYCVLLFVPANSQCEPRNSKRITVESART